MLTLHSIQVMVNIGIALSEVASSAFLQPRDLDRLRAVATLVPLGVLQAGNLPAALADVDILLSSWGQIPLDAAFLAAAPRLRLVAYTAGSVRGFATPEAFNRGVTITTAMHGNAQAVADATSALIILASKSWFLSQDLIRNQGRAGYDLCRHSFNQPSSQPGAEPPYLSSEDLTVGLVGFGAIARLVVERLRFIAPRVVVYDPHVSDAALAAAGAERASSLPELAAQADIVSVHAPDIPATRGMCNAAFFEAMRPGTCFINTARGRLVDEAALIRTLESGRIQAFLDVTEPEPPVADSPLYRLPNCWLTPHRAGSGGKELRRMGRLAIEECLRFVAGQPPLHQVTPAMLATMA